MEQKTMFDWVPHTPPAKSVPARHVPNSKESKKASKNETPEMMNRETREKIKRFRPKVYDRTKPKKKPSTSTPKPKKRCLTTDPINPSTPKLTEASVEHSKDIDQEEVGGSNRKNCKRKLDLLDFDDQNGNMDHTLEVFDKVVPLLKKARMRRSRATNFDKFVKFVGEITRVWTFSKNSFDKWAAMRRKRSEVPVRRKRSKVPVRRKRLNIKCVVNHDLIDRPELAHVEVEDSIEHPELLHDNVVVSSNSNISFNGDIQHLEETKLESEFIRCSHGDVPTSDDEGDEEEHDKEDDDEEHDCLRDNNLYTKALSDFSSQMMESLHIDDPNTQKQLELVVRNLFDSIIVPKEKSVTTKKPRPKVNFDAPIESDENNADDDKIPKDTKLFESRVREFISILNHIQGNRLFSPWKGSVVDSVVGVFLTQNVSDHHSSQAFMNLASKFPNDEVDPEQLLIENDPSQTRPVDPEQLSIMEKDPLSTVEKDPMLCPVSQTSQVDPEDGNVHSSKTKCKNKDKEEDTSHWDKLRVQYSTNKKRTDRNRDFVNWEAVRQTSQEDLSIIIKERGMKDQLAQAIKDFLDRIYKDHGSLDLEWLRDVPPEKAKEYLLSIHRLGLKSTECVRLLSLHHQAFPVDVNITRVTSRVGWIPMDLPPEIPMHLLQKYPNLNDVQKYIWKHILNLSHAELYQAHCHMILFGKSICTPHNPNCDACPFKPSCRHYASLTASKRPLVEGSENKASQSSESASSQGSVDETSQLMLPGLDADLSAGSSSSYSCEPVIEMPESPVHECTDTFLQDIEDMESEDEMPWLNFCSDNSEHCESKALITVNMAAKRPAPPLKNKKRLRTEHHVYELPDTSPLLAGFDIREPEEKTPYLLAIWMPKKTDGDQGSTEVVKYQDEKIVQGTILIPCRTANRGFFPLNGTYFQINEVFADHETSHNPINIPREWIWNLQRRALFCATSVSSACRDMDQDEMRYFFTKGAMCIRGFDRRTKAPKALERKFHVSTANREDMF
ncbi:hypothetical protein CASFOL_021666 [Castilleja foliolosa]|uniref:Demeter RRM-fold domain-containing protein n=1 Tax=Castilleja foliolosa TaxID=1961234 RepID=A0ABD3CYR4_9LAMI